MLQVRNQTKRFFTSNLSKAKVDKLSSPLLNYNYAVHDTRLDEDKEKNDKDEKSKMFSAERLLEFEKDETEKKKTTTTSGPLYSSQFKFSNFSKDGSDKDLTPKKLFEEFEKHVIGQTDAKKNLAIAFRIYYYYLEYLFRG